MDEINRGLSELNSKTKSASSSTSRTEILRLYQELNRLKLNLKAELILNLIQDYQELNQTVVRQIIEDNLNRNQQLKQELNRHIQALIHNTNNNDGNSINHLRLISQSHPSLLEPFYLQTTKTTTNTIAHLINQLDQLQEQKSRRELLSIILKVLKDGIINRLRTASVAFDSTELIDQLILLSSSKSTRFLTELYLNYPTLIIDLQQLIKTRSQQANHKKDRLDLFFNDNQSIHPIFKIYNDRTCSNASRINTNGKGKENQKEEEFESIINQVLQILPDLTSRVILNHIIKNNHQFQDQDHGAQRLIEQSFVDPSFISQNSIEFSNSSSSVTPTLIQPQHQSSHVILKNRKNIFDHVKMDPNLLRIGKSKLNEQEILNDKSHITKEMKKQIQRDKKGKPVINVDIFEDDDHRFNIRDEDDGDRSDPEEEEVVDRNHSLSPFPPLTTPKRANNKTTKVHQPLQPHSQPIGSTQKIDPRDQETLCSFILNDPSVFSSKSRTSKNRIDLKNSLIHFDAHVFVYEAKKEEILERYRMKSMMKDPDNRSILVGEEEGGSKSTNSGLERGEEEDVDPEAAEEEEEEEEVEIGGVEEEEEEEVPTLHLLIPIKTLTILRPIKPLIVVNLLLELTTPKLLLIEESVVEIRNWLKCLLVSVKFKSLARFIYYYSRLE
ncbi:hypothetical protein H4Q26_011938 [Puccinia striiformis f. sp. tritici PST-130]|nr:hypothetical protein H4Q26_011938 [Puccinia striiformis f. sp. tritici PST-130]